MEKRKDTLDTPQTSKHRTWKWWFWFSWFSCFFREYSQVNHINIILIFRGITGMEGKKYRKKTIRTYLGCGKNIPGCNRHRDVVNQGWGSLPHMINKFIWAMVKSRYIGDGHPTFNRNPSNGYINPYYWVDDHPLLYGNNGSLDPGTYLVVEDVPNLTLWSCKTPSWTSFQHQF